MIVSLLVSLLLCQSVFIYRARVCFCFSEPSEAASVLPFAFTASASINFTFMTNAMLKILLPHADIHCIVFDHSSFAPLLALLKCTVVLAPVCPDLLALAMHLASLEITDVGHFLLSEEVLALAVELILHKAAFEITTILPSEVAFAFFLVLNKVTLKSAKCSFPRLSSVSI